MNLERCSRKTVNRLASDYATLSRSNLATNHADIVEHIITLEEQIATFSEMLQITEKDSAKICDEILPEIHEQYAALQPTFRQIDKLQELVDTAQKDTDTIEAKLCAAEEAANKSSIKNVIKSQLGKLSVTRDRNAGASGDQNKTKYEPVNIFKTEDFLK
eukprot:TRINITY_DN16873_c0_g1_i3.p1 TRINITY_DN16873_c0_g1~~TRINITY_DN16873_c0_g1_i3.p1  ORF type:complete len:160 (+),score=31.97 TRINITY_DN16873_c0_g1_i3:40-519(+)